jgi:hypothetical protein
VAMTGISYGLLLKTYMKYIHNRPLDSGISAQQIVAQKELRRRQLGLFCIIGVPLTILILRTTFSALKDLFTLTIGESAVANPNSNSNSINSIIFISNLITKIPR